MLGAWEHFRISAGFLKEALGFVALNSDVVRRCQSSSSSNTALVLKPRSCQGLWLLL